MQTGGVVISNTACGAQSRRGWRSKPSPVTHERYSQGKDNFTLSTLYLTPHNVPSRMYRFVEAGTVVPSFMRLALTVVEPLLGGTSSCLDHAHIETCHCRHQRRDVQPALDAVVILTVRWPVGRSQPPLCSMSRFQSGELVRSLPTISQHHHHHHHHIRLSYVATP
ncbi:hypothetical protein BDY17DRAFT_104484 [Neohortaea acidophila]|uniref:Uncharacterized protein n=1 Tax=Neohortaea acidophila TaxID=245834 RepID=A0A6A6Q0G8_9PEZI|nr:uncharacterized protein BDY17DRAFT_104484 [Neohortaea acidophila]KAF2485479.1 hypothetical protein BDY17DRAFT_104484 [Neohortaea acidophila]